MNPLAWQGFLHYSVFKMWFKMLSSFKPQVYTNTPIIMHLCFYWTHPLTLRWMDYTTLLTEITGGHLYIIQVCFILMPMFVIPRLFCLYSLIFWNAEMSLIMIFNHFYSEKSGLAPRLVQLYILLF